MSDSSTPISIPMPVFRRLTSYLYYLKHLPENGQANTSATLIAEAMNLNQVQVRKDLASVSNRGKPKIGYIVEELISDIEHFLGYNHTKRAMLVGAGNLGRALLMYDNLKKYGLDIVAAVDADESLIGTTVAGVTIFSPDKLANLCRRMQVLIGIITVPADEAQGVCDRLVESEVCGIWNFTPVHLSVPDSVVVQDVDMASSLAILTNKLTEKYGEVTVKKD